MKFRSLCFLLVLPIVCIVQMSYASNNHISLAPAFKKVDQAAKAYKSNKKQQAQQLIKEASDLMKKNNPSMPGYFTPKAVEKFIRGHWVEASFAKKDAKSKAAITWLNKTLKTLQA